jgi:hypothetical protein
MSKHGSAVYPAFRRLRQEDHEFKASQGYILRLVLKKKKGPQGGLKKKKRTPRRWF